MKPAPVSYARPQTIESACRLMASDEDARVLAGGQSLIPLINFRLARPSLLVDVTAIEGLDAITRDGDFLAVGAAVRQRALEGSADALLACPLLGQALRHVGHPQTRSRGTIVGSIAHADPAAELPAVVVATDAQMVAVGLHGRRSIPADSFYLGPLTTALEQDEILIEVRFPADRWDRTAFREVARRSGDFALAGVAAALRFDRDSDRRVADARLVGIGVGSVPLRLRDAEAELCGRSLDASAIARSGRAAAACLQETDVDVDSSYRRRVLAVLVERVLEELSG